MAPRPLADQRYLPIVARVLYSDSSSNTAPALCHVGPLCVLSGPESHPDSEQKTGTRLSFHHSISTPRLTQPVPSRIERQEKTHHTQPNRIQQRTRHLRRQPPSCPSPTLPFLGHLPLTYPRPHYHTYSTPTRFRRMTTSFPGPSNLLAGDPCTDF